MERVHFRYKILTTVKFTEEEAKLLVRCSQEHYDRTCRAASTPGPGAFIHGMTFDFDVALDSASRPKESTYELESRELDLACKITEQLFAAKDPAVTALHEKLHQLLVESNDEYRRINNHLLKESPL